MFARTYILPRKYLWVFFVAINYTIQEPLKVSQFFLIVIFSIIFYTLSFKTYTIITRTPIGVKIFFPLKIKKIKEHFIEKYDMEFKINEITYYLDMGSEASSGGWKKSISGYLIDDPETPIKVWISEDEISDDYEKTLFEREAKAYYEEILRENIPWEFKPYLYIYHVYSLDEGKSYKKIFKEKNNKIISRMSFSIMSSSDILKKYGKNEYQNIYLKVVKMLYEKNYYSEDIIISFRLLDIKPEVLKNEGAKKLFLEYAHVPYLLAISTEDLEDDFLEVKSFNELEKYMKNKSLKGVERWIEN